MLTLTEDIIFQSELDKQDINQISEKKFQNLTDFDFKILQRVRFWIKNFTTRQIFNRKNYNASDFDEKYFFKKHDFEEKFIFKKHDFEEKFIFKKQDCEEKNILEKQILKKKIYTQKIAFWFFLPRKMRKFCVLRAILKSTILNKKIF